MKKIVLLLLLNLSYIFASNIKAAYAIGIFDENGNGENIQHKKITQSNYNGTCYSKIIVFSKNSFYPKVTIGNSIGHFVKSSPIYSKRKILIGKELTFKHYNITKGYFQVRIDEKLYDSKVFIK